MPACNRGDERRATSATAAAVAVAAAVANSGSSGRADPSSSRAPQRQRQQQARGRRRGAAGSGRTHCTPPEHAAAQVRRDTSRSSEGSTQARIVGQGVGHTRERERRCMPACDRGDERRATSATAAAVAVAAAVASSGSSGRADPSSSRAPQRQRQQQERGRRRGAAGSGRTHCTPPEHAAAQVRRDTSRSSEGSTQARVVGQGVGHTGESGAACRRAIAATNGAPSRQRRRWRWQRRQWRAAVAAAARIEAREWSQDEGPLRGGCTGADCDTQRQPPTPTTPRFTPPCREQPRIGLVTTSGEETLLRGGAAR